MQLEDIDVTTLKKKKGLQVVLQEGRLQVLQQYDHSQIIGQGEKDET